MSVLCSSSSDVVSSQQAMRPWALTKPHNRVDCADHSWKAWSSWALLFWCCLHR